MLEGSKDGQTRTEGGCFSQNGEEREVQLRWPRRTSEETHVMDQEGSELNLGGWEGFK